MRFAALAILGLFTTAACDQRQSDEAGRTTGAADTIVTSEENVDTAIITTDTTVDVDTTTREGDQPVSRDTLQEPSTPSADTGLADTTQQ